MDRLHHPITLALMTAVVAGLAATAAHAQQQRNSRPPPRPPVIIQDRGLINQPPPPPSSERNFYGPAPSMQRPMERVPQPAPLAQPPINR